MTLAVTPDVPLEELGPGTLLAIGEWVYVVVSASVREDGQYELEVVRWRG